MKSGLLFAAAAVALGSAASASSIDDTLRALNHTGEASTSRQLVGIPVTFRMTGVDIIGLDTVHRARPNPDECFNFCVSIASDLGDFQPCTAATWTNQDGGMCYAKNTQRKIASTTPKAEAESFFILISPDRSFIWSNTMDGFDMAGFDLTSTRGSGMGDCMNACNANSNCYAVTWTNYQGGTCWLKKRASGYVAKAGAKTAYVARKFNGPT